MIQELKQKAAEHWREWLPRKWASLMASGMVDQALTTAATQAEQEIRQWMERGARLDEAEEIVLPQLILLPPENPESLGDADLDEELQAKEAQTRKIYLSDQASLNFQL